MSTYRQRDIVLVPFPFSDLSSAKVRPVLVLSNDAYNAHSADILVCGITTNLSPAPYSEVLMANDVEVPGSLRHISRIKADTIASLDQSLVIKPIARVKIPVFVRVLAHVSKLVALP